MTTPARTHIASHRARASRFALTSALTILALSAACVLSVLIAGRYKLRLDVTATGEHSLAPRTLSLLDSLDRPVSVVVSANLQRLDRRIRQRLNDALGAFADASPQLTIMRIDTGSPGAADAYAHLIADLAKRETPAIDATTTAANQALDELTRLSHALTDLASQCRAIAGAAPEDVASQWTDAAGVLDALATELGQTIDQATPLTATPYAGVSLPEPDAILKQLDPVVQRIGRALGALQSHASKKQSDELSDDVQKQIKHTGDTAHDLLQLAADALDHLRRSPRLDALNIARLLAQREAIVVIGPQRATAVDFDALFPAANLDAGADRNASSASLAFAGEDLIDTAIATATSAAQPAVVFVHAETKRVFNDDGTPGADAAPTLTRLITNLRLRQIGLGEWPVALDTPMPTRASLGLDDNAPLVWFVLDAPPSTAPDGLSRIKKLGDAIQRLTDRGQSILLTIDPSQLPSVGETNPIVQPLSAFGLQSDSGRVVISRVSAPTGPQFIYTHTFRRADTDNPIGAAIDGLATLLPTPTPIDITTKHDTTAWPILSIDAADNTWAEARWQSLLAQRVTNEPPTPDPEQDALQGPFDVVVAAERRRAPTEPAAIRSGDAGIQRLVVVASRSWYIDQIAEQRMNVEGRQVARYPGNRELLSAAITWLAGRDELIARSPEVADVPRIKPLTAGQVAAIRWFLIAGMPALVLAVGVALRLIRR